jgi:hypothetical protein
MLLSLSKMEVVGPYTPSLGVTVSGCTGRRDLGMILWVVLSLGVRGGLLILRSWLVLVTRWAGVGELCWNRDSRLVLLVIGIIVLTWNRGQVRDRLVVLGHRGRTDRGGWVQYCRRTDLVLHRCWVVLPVAGLRRGVLAQVVRLGSLVVKDALASMAVLTRVCVGSQSIEDHVLG